MLVYSWVFLFRKILQKQNKMRRFNQMLVIFGGVIYILLAVFNLSISLYLQKNAEFSQLNPAYSKIAQLLNIGIIVFFFSLGFIILRHRKEMLTSALGKSILLMSAVFFLIRGAAEFLFDNIAYGLIGTMAICTIIFLLPVFLKEKS